MSSASRMSGTRRRMKLRSRDCSRLTTPEIRWSCSTAIRSRLVAAFTCCCGRMRAEDIVGSAKLLIDQLWQDGRYGLRQLRRQPGFAAVAIVTMALGIGATTMLFSVAYGVLLKPLPWSGSDQLLRVTEMRQGRAGRVLGTLSNGTFLAWRDRPST